MERQRVVVVILVILLILAGGYIAYTKYMEREALIFQSGATWGYKQAILEIIRMAVKCEQVPVYAENESISLVAVECLQPKTGNLSR